MRSNLSKNSIFFTLLLLLTSTGCLGPHYIRPVLEIPEEWRNPDNTDSTLGNVRWWEQFQDPVLNDLIEIALDNNQDIQLAISRVCEYHARLGVVNADFYPYITGQLSYNRFRTSQNLQIEPLPGINPISNDFLGIFSASWELDFWGRIRSASAAAYAELLGKIEARRAVVVTVVASVAKAYILLRQLDAQLKVSKKTLQSRLESLKLAQDRFDLGETSEIEVKQAASNVEIAAIRMIEFERDIPQQENQLSILLGMNPQAMMRGKPIDTFEYPCEIPEGLPSDLLIRRPDIVEAEDLLIAADARISQARALFFPQISLTGNYGYESDQLSSFLAAPSRTWQYGLSAIQIIFNAGKTCYLVQAAQALRDQAIANYKQTILNAFADVDNALVAYWKNRELVLEHEKQVKILEEYLNLARLRYNEGEVDYLNVLDAERSLFTAELELVTAQSDSFIAAVDLYAALGGGWVDDADATALNATCAP